ncbi:MAG TPA: family 20 glycosylhydrolase [Candidatus Saccharimonadales bacterium]|nr:family 20 glycosylhydrolase [Candidatus Saccharimonadales bacterium]
MTVNRWFGGVLFLVLAGLISMNNAAAQQSTLNIMPLPAKAQMGSGNLRIDGGFSVALTGFTEPRLERSAQRFLKQMALETGLLIAPRTGDASKATLVVHTDHASKAIQELGEDESYTLEVTATGAKLSAATPLGAMYGLQTFLQLVDVTTDGFALPVVTIQDQPRFPWRGTMYDVGRHFIPLDVLKRNIDGLEAVKMNVFHWHLSENQGFRIESKKFPKLHGKGSDGLYYTQDEVRDLIAYARERGIRVVPEFDLPGHSTAWFVGYPELSAGSGPYEIERKWGVQDPAFDPTNEQVYKFLDQFIGEMAKIFPDQFFHVGGDEVNGKQWNANPKIQAFIKEHNLKDDRGLQAYFNKRLQAIVTKHGKSMIGWDEVLDPSLPKDVTIHSWRGPESLAAAARQGYRGILSNGYYIDLGWSAARHYVVDPMSGAAANLSAEEKQRILGGESTMWSEYVNGENVDSRVWPRNAAIAERLWSPQDVTDLPSMYARMEAESLRLEWLGLTHKTVYRRMLQRIAGPAAAPDEFAALRALADVVEPVKDYKREETATVEPTSLTPMNRVVDAIPLESSEGRRFAEQVNKYLAASCNDAARETKIRAQLALWRDNDAKLQPLAERSTFVKEVSGASRALSALGAAGLEALDLIAKGQPGKVSTSAAVDEAIKPHGQLLLIPATAVQKLVAAAADRANCAAGK